MPRMAYERRHTCEDRKSPPGKRIPPSFAVTATGFSVRPDFDFPIERNRIHGRAAHGRRSRGSGPGRGCQGQAGGTCAPLDWCDLLKPRERLLRHPQFRAHLHVQNASVNSNVQKALRTSVSFHIVTPYISCLWIVRLVVLFTPRNLLF